MKRSTGDALRQARIRFAIAAAIGSAFAFFAFLPLFGWARSSSSLVLQVLGWFGPLPQLLVPDIGDVALSPAIPKSVFVWLGVRTAIRATLFVFALIYFMGMIGRIARRAGRVMRRSGPDWPALIVWSVLGVVGGAIAGVFAAAYCRTSYSLAFAATVGALVFGGALPALRALVQGLAVPRNGDLVR